MRSHSSGTATRWSWPTGRCSTCWSSFRLAGCRSPSCWTCSRRCDRAITPSPPHRWSVRRYAASPPASSADRPFRHRPVHRGRLRAPGPAPGPRHGLRLRPRARIAFRPPEDTQVPMIMVGAGTGVAPFRGFLQERAAQQEGRPCRAVPAVLRLPHLPYRLALRRGTGAYQEQGLVRVENAFSNDPSHPSRYVQEAVLDCADEVWQLLHGRCCDSCLRQRRDDRARRPEVAQAHLPREDLDDGRGRGSLAERAARERPVRRGHLGRLTPAGTERAGVDPQRHTRKRSPVRAVHVQPMAASTLPRGPRRRSPRVRSRCSTLPRMSTGCGTLVRRRGLSAALKPHRLDMYRPEPETACECAAGGRSTPPHCVASASRSSRCPRRTGRSRAARSARLPRPPSDR